MLYYENNQFNICPFIAYYMTYGQKQFKYTNDKQWWTEFVNKWWHHRDLQFTQVIPTQAQLDRLAEINKAGISESYKSDASSYVESGLFFKDEEGNIRPLFEQFTESPDLSNSMLKTEYELAIENLMNKKAQEKSYKDADRLMAYTSSSKQEWKDEANAFITWRDDVFMYCFDMIQDIVSQNRNAPNDFLGELPVIKWPE